jgi:hypothetical protein
LAVICLKEPARYTPGAGEAGYEKREQRELVPGRDFEYVWTKGDELTGICRSSLVRKFMFYNYLLNIIQTGPGAHPASCTIGTRLFSAVKRPGRDVNHPLTISTEVKNDQSCTSAPSLF